MRRSAILGLMILGLAAAKGAFGSSTESFHAFIGNFASDAKFRADRTSDPLPVRFGNQAVTEVLTARWPAEQVKAQTVPFVSSRELAERGLKQKIKKMDSHTVEVLQYRDEADSYLITYRFELRGGKWYLAEYRDESL